MRRCLSDKRFLLVVLTLAAHCRLWGLDGAAVTVRAQAYLDCDWTCHTRNARVETNAAGVTLRSNVDDDADNNIWRHPFYPAGAAFKDYDGNTKTAITGTSQGVAYCWGQRDHAGEYEGNTLVAFTELIASEEPIYLAGQEPNSIHLDTAGVDCSGLAFNCLGFPLHYRHVNNYREPLHYVVADAFQDYFSDGIGWNEIKKGDVLAYTTSGSSHVAVAIGSPSNNKVEVIEAAPRYYETGNEKQGVRA